jgi:hypothetical protein
LPWKHIEAVLAPYFARTARPGQTSADEDLFGEVVQDIGVKPKQVVADLGYRGVDADNPDIELLHRGKYKSMSAKERRWLKRRQAVEPIIGHLKHDCRMAKCWLKGALGDALNTVLSAAGYNLRWLMRAVLDGRIKRLFLRLFLAIGLSATGFAAFLTAVGDVVRGLSGSSAQSH